MSELIDRQEAIDRFNVIRPVDPKKDEYTKGIDVGIAMCIVAVKDQPTIQPENAQLSQQGTTSDMISRQAAIDALDCISGVEEVLRNLPSVQPESSDKFIPPEQLAIKLGTATIHSAMQWIEFCNALEFLGYAIVERRTDEIRTP